MNIEGAGSVEFDPNSVRKVVSVQAPQAVAWRVFTEKMGAWWPLAYYKIGKANAVDAVIEPRVGGRWYERGDDGSMCQWGSVLAWEPHSRLVLSWDINADWQYDPTLKTEIEVRFNADGSEPEISGNGTRCAAALLIDAGTFSNEKSSNIKLWGSTCLDKWGSVSISPI